MRDVPLACLQLIHSTARSGKIRDALMHYRDPAMAWDALCQLDRSLKPGLKAKQALLDRGRAWLEGSGNHLIAWHEPDYPPPLRQTASPPPFLFVRGRRDMLWHPQIAIVGTRQASAAGTECAHYFARTLAAQGYTITSGLASGIDAAAHEGALLTGHTLAALATGPDLAFPRSNAGLYRRICETGAIVTEHPPGVPALRSHFPARNRIIAALSQGTLVIEAAIRSGALITARLAAELGKEVMAVPGSIHNPVAYGCHQLIREGAFLVEQPEEVRYILGCSLGAHASGVIPDAQLPPNPPTTSPEPQRLNTQQQQVWQALGHDAVAIDTLCLRTGLTAADISSILMDMELSGWVESHFGRYHRGMHDAPSARG
jgi:DNA processing protein